MAENEVSQEEVMKAVTELRGEVEKKGFIDQEKVNRIELVLDQAEDRNQQLMAIQQESKNLDTALTELKDLRQAEKEEGIKGATELKTQITALEAEIARGAARSNQPEALEEAEEYKSLNQWCVNGSEIAEEHKANLRTDNAVQGGVLVPRQLNTAITKKIVEIDPIRSVARVRSVSGKSLDLAIRSTIPTATYEGEAETGADSTSTYESKTVTPFRQTFTTPVTMDMLMDAAFDMNSEIASDAAEAFAFGEGNGFVLGDGFKNPAGFAVDATLNADARAGGGSSGVIDEDDVILLSGDLKAGYNPVYVLNRRTLALIRVKKSTTGAYLWQPGLNGPVANTLNGFPYALANSMPDVASNAYALAFGDFSRGYTIVDRTGMSVIRDEFTLKKKAIVEFTMNRWNTGLVTLHEAIKLLKIKA